MVMTALVAGGAGVFTHGASDLRTSSRTNLRRGLAASAALHLLLLAVFLSASGGGEAVVRTYLRPAELLLEPLRPLPPPTISREPVSPAERLQPEDGIIDPKVMRPDIPLAPIRPVQPSRQPVPGGEPGSPSDGGDIPTLGATPAPPPDDIYQVVDQAPVPIFAPTPVYPSWARDAGVTGQVLLKVLVGKDGRVRRVVIEKNVDGLGEAAREALARWVFRPARMNGAAVSTWVAIPVRFEL